MRRLAILILTVAMLGPLATRFAFASDWPFGVKGYHLDEDKAEKQAIKEAIKLVTAYLKDLKPPLVEWQPDEKFIQGLIQASAPGKDIKDGDMIYKTWILKLRSPDLAQLTMNNRRALEARCTRELAENSRERIALTGWAFSGILGLLTITVAGAHIMGRFVTPRG